MKNMGGTRQCNTMDTKQKIRFVSSFQFTPCQSVFAGVTHKK